METICIMCPMGCSLNVVNSSGGITVTGNLCKKGITYGTAEFTAPKRVITTLVKTKSNKVVACKSNGMIPKDRIFDCLNIIKTNNVDDGLAIGTVIIENILSLGIDIVITSTNA